MSVPRRLLLLSADRVSAHAPHRLGHDAAASWLTAWRALWHPALFRDADSLPEIADPHEHIEPQPNCIYSVPAPWPMPLGDDWPHRVQAVCSQIAAIDEVPHDFAGLGFVYLIIDALYEVMGHARQLDKDALLGELRDGVVQKAAERLLAARGVLYPVPIHLIDAAIAGHGSLPGTMLNLIATADAIEVLSPTERDLIRQRLEAGTLELCGGLAMERPDLLLPAESQLWNLRRGQERLQTMLGRRATVFAQAFAALHPAVPQLLQQAQLSKAWLAPFVGGRSLFAESPAVRWSGGDGRWIESLVRSPEPAGDAQTFFNLAYLLHQSIMHDSSALFALLHGVTPAGPWYHDWLAVSRLAPILGEWTLVSAYLDNNFIVEHVGPMSVDDFVNDGLLATQNDAIGRSARHTRQRREFDAAMTYLALSRGLGVTLDDNELSQMVTVENHLETSGFLPLCGGGLGWGVAASGVGQNTPHPSPPPQGERGQEGWGEAASVLTARLLRGATGERGLLVLNPCAYPRRASLERTDLPGCPPVGGPVIASQQDGDLVQVVVEVPAFGYTWVPAVATPQLPPKLTLAEGTTLRNEFFEAEIDPATGGLRGLRHPRERSSRLGQQLIWQPGGVTRATSILVTANGPALGEITTEGELVNDLGQRIAGFAQRFRAWIGRPMLELRIELHPDKAPNGEPWHDYLGSRFAWRDERAALCAGMMGRSSVTMLDRIVAPEFLEVHSGDKSVLIVTGGLPFHQRRGPRMIDTLLITSVTSERVFDLAIGLDRPQPGLSAQGMISPLAVMRAEHGPPLAGPTGWLMHLDAGNLLLTSLRPERDSVTARFFETAGVAGTAHVRCARDPASAALVDGTGELLADATIDGDTVTFLYRANEVINLNVRWEEKS